MQVTQRRKWLALFLVAGAWLPLTITCVPPVGYYYGDEVVVDDGYCCGDGWGFDFGFFD